MKKTLAKLLILIYLMLTLAACGESTAETGNAVRPASPPNTPAATVAKTSSVASTPTAATPKPTLKSESGPATNEPIQLRFSEFYAAKSSPVNLEFSEKLQAANGKLIKITGYMAPPLKPDLDFFVLTKIKLAVCPFCSTAAEWPQDIMLVTMGKDKTVKQIEEPITVIGKLEIGEAVDPETGFFSMLRLRGESVEIFKGS